MSTDRLELVKGSFEKKALPADVPQKKVSDYFGELVFDRVKMRKYLDAKTLASLLDCIDKGGSLDRETADMVAKGIKEWALEHNVTHVTHWFQPLTEGTAEKHDSLIDYDGKGGIIETSQVNSFFQRICEKAGVPAMGQHSLRHTFATRCIEAGIQAVVLKKWMGHTDIHITLDTYTDVFDRMNNESTEFSVNGTVLQATASRELDYEGAEVDLSIYINDIEEYVKGVYTLEVYTEKSLLGKAECMLR